MIGIVSYEYRGNAGQADLIETEADGGKDSFRDDELADLEERFGSKVKYNPASALGSARFSSITSVARPVLEHETFSHHWIQKSKEVLGSRNFFAKKT
jgi:hypothetical protein